MSWFDKLFGEDNDSNDDLLRKNKKRRQGTQSQQNNQDSLLPQNNDIYNRPRGKFRFPMHVSEESSFSDVDNDSNYDTSGYDVYSDSSSDYTQGHNFTRNIVDNSGKRHRRRRSSQLREQDYMNQQSNRNEEQMPRESSRTKRNSNNSQSYAYRENKKDKSNSRMKLQSERLKSNSKLQSSSNSELTYHGGSFKASEVPSAIFGTKQRRPLENGVIPPKHEPSQSNGNETHRAQVKQPTNAHDVNMYRQSINKQMGYQSEEASSKNNKSQLDNQAKTSDNEQTQKTSSNHLQSKNNTAQKSEGQTPNYSKRDNTVNIENIYASQIVEEIRRERERKVLQKRRFKKALQQKRQQNKDNEEDQIQKAIDEMYAKQAHQYIGESSLDEDDNDDINDEESNDGAERITNTSFKEDQIGASSYNYEEINLDDERHIQQVHDEDVYVNNASSGNDTDETSVEETHNNDIEDAQFQELNDSQQSLESSSHIDNDNSQQQHQYNDAINQSVDTEKEYAKHRQKNDNNHQESASSLSTSETLNDSTSTIVNSSNDDSAFSSFNSKQSMTANEGQSFINDDIDNKNDNDSEMNRDVDAESSSHFTDSEQNSDSDSNQSLNDSESDDSTSTSEFTSQSESSVVQESEINRPTTQSQSSDTFARKPRVGGSKPFNVVMTPSDKKRMMDNKNNSRVNVPELKPEQRHVQSTVEDSDKHTDTSENNINHSEIDQQRVEDHQTNSESNHDDNANVSTHGDDNHKHNQQNTLSTSHIESNVQSSGNHFSETTQDNDANRDNDKDSEMNITHQNVQEPESKSFQEHQESQQAKQQGIRKGPNIKLPSFDLLEEPEPHEVNEEWIEDKKQELNDALYYFNVPAEVKNVTEGPSVTRFELSVEKGVKVSRITALQDDIKMALAAKDIRIEAPIPGTSLVGIEVPNQDPTKVNLRSIIETPKFKNTESKLTVAMGYRINNEPLLMDIAKTPHALIAGATGSGKSVCINSILMSLLYKNHPEELRLLLIDPKMVELAPYNDLPHLVSPVITDVKAATQSLKWAVEEMEKRYKLFAQYHVRNITAFNKKAPYEQRMPKIVIVIDELADLMMMAPQEVEQSIARIAQKARACGIHMLVATQRPSVNVITGLIKANIPTRIAFMVSSSVDSRTILDSGGAERLLGYGDMLYLGSGMNKPIRVQGTFVSDEEIDDVVDFIKQQREPEYLFEEKELLKKTQSQAQDDLFDDVCEFMVNEGHISTSLIQRHFQIGYNRAARIIDQLEQLGYISGANGSKPRDVYITEADLNKE